MANNNNEGLMQPKGTASNTPITDIGWIKLVGPRRSRRYLVKQNLDKDVIHY